MDVYNCEIRSWNIVLEWKIAQFLEVKTHLLWASGSQSHTIRDPGAGAFPFQTNLRGSRFFPDLDAFIQMAEANQWNLEARLDEQETRRAPLALWCVKSSVKPVAWWARRKTKDVLQGEKWIKSPLSFLIQTVICEHLLGWESYKHNFLFFKLIIFFLLVYLEEHQW